MTDDNDSIKTKAVDWMTGQSFNNVLLACILIGGAWGLKYIITTAIPPHLLQIQEGYERIQDSHKLERKEIREQYDTWMSRMMDRRVVAE